MVETREPPLQEKIRHAVRPLTENNECQLITIGNGFTFRMDQIEVELYSKNMKIVFNGRNESRFPQTYCRFYIPSLQRVFFTEDLFNATGIDIAFGISDPRYPVGKNRPVTDIDYLDFYADLERLCREMRKNWKKIRALFTPDGIDETVRRYINERSRRGIPDKKLSDIPSHASDHELSRGIATGRPVPDFRDILEAMVPLANVCNRFTVIILHVADGRIDITDHFNAGSHAEFLFHTNNDGRMDVFCIARPWRNTPYQHTTNTSILLPEDPELVVFSLENLARMLQIEYTGCPGDLLADLNGYCLFISENAEKISSVLDYDHLRKTYTLLKDCPGNKQDEILQVLSNVDVFHD
jgi:hypothetical protein